MNRREIFYAIRAVAVEPLGDGADEPLFNTVDMWNKNIEFLEDECPFELPALFVEFGEVNYTPLKGREERGLCDVVLHVVVDGHADDVMQCVERCDALVDRLRSMPWYGTRVQSLTNHDHAEIIECLEVVRVGI